MEEVDGQKADCRFFGKVRHGGTTRSENIAVRRLPRYKLIFEEEAGEYILAQTKRRQRRLMDICYSIAADPLASPDYVLPDADGRPVSHVLTEGYLIGYWIDAPVKRVVIAEIEAEE